MNQQSQVDQLQETVAMLMQAMNALQSKVDSHDEIIKQKDTIIAERDAEIERQREIIRSLQRMIFGQRSEKTVYLMDGAEQISLFGEALPGTVPAKETEEVKVAAHTRKSKRSYDEIFDILPNEDVVYDVPVEKRLDANGEPLEYLGQERVRRELHTTRQELKVINIYRKCYGSKRKGAGGSRETVVKADVPQAFYPHSYASPSLIADVITKKYLYGLPLYRQERYFKEHGIALSRNTLASWVIYTADNYLKSVYDILCTELLKQDVIHTDETPIQVLKEPGKKPTTKSQMWVYTTDKLNPHPITCFQYRDNRSGECPTEFLKGFTGTLVADAFSGYNLVAGVTRAGCWAHMRRKWYEAIPSDYRAKGSSAEKLDLDKAKSKGYTEKALVPLEMFQLCSKLFSLEREFENLTPDERKQQRQLKSKPVVEEYFQKLSKIQSPSGNLKKACTYATNQKEPLCTFLNDGNIEISNNAAERAVRQVVIGRKNWLFSDTQDGARATAIAYSIMNTAKFNGLRVYEYLEHLLDTIYRTPKNLLDLNKLLPWSQEMQAAFRME